MLTIVLTIGLLFAMIPIFMSINTVLLGNVPIVRNARGDVKFTIICLIGNLWALFVIIYFLTITL